MRLLLIATFLLPLLMIPALLRGRALSLAPWTLLPGLALALLASENLMLELPWLLLGTSLGLDASGRVFLFFSAGLWLIAGLYGNAYLRGDPLRRRFSALFLSTAAGNLGLIVAQDAGSFYAFYALMTFAAYGLVIHSGTPSARRAGLVYLSMAVFGEMLLLVALLLAADAAASVRIGAMAAAITSSPQGESIAAFLLLGFGVKIGLPLLHMWLPLAHPVAPTPASAVLSGVMVKAGLLGWLRFLPLGLVALPELGLALMLAGLTAVFLGVAAGLLQDNAKSVLAYSTISQMGYLTLGVGAGLGTPALWPLLLPALLLYAVQHAFAKAALFLGVGVLQAARDDAARRLALAGLLLPALALAGAPLSGGLLAKTALKVPLLALPPPWPSLLVLLLALGSVATALLLARFLTLAWQRADALPTRTGLAASWCLALLGCLLAPWVALAGLGLSAPAAGSQLWGAAWPLLLATGAWLLLARWRPAVAVPSMPPGDLLIPLQSLLDHALRCWQAVASVVQLPAPPAWLNRFRCAPILPPALRQPALALLGVLALLLLALQGGPG